MVAEARPPNFSWWFPPNQLATSQLPSCMYFSGPRSVRFHFNSSWLYRSVDPTVVVIPADYLRSGSPPPKKNSRTATMGYLNITWWVVELTHLKKKWSSKWVFGVKIKNIWYHHLVTVHIPFCRRCGRTAIGMIKVSECEWVSALRLAARGQINAVVNLPAMFRCCSDRWCYSNWPTQRRNSEEEEEEEQQQQPPPPPPQQQQQRQRQRQRQPQPQPQRPPSRISLEFDFLLDPPISFCQL